MKMKIELKARSTEGERNNAESGRWR